jgi:hypothetical protein
LYNVTADVSINDTSFINCESLETLELFDLKYNLDLKYSNLISKDSILLIINNEAATSAITIILHSNAYKRLATDVDIVAALNNHPLVSLASV